MSSTTTNSLVTDLRNPGHLKIALLSHGMDFDPALRAGLGSRYQEKVYSYSVTDWTDGRKELLPSEIRLDGKCYVGFHYRQSSEFALRPNGDGLPWIYHHRVPLMPASLISRPKYYAHTTSDGVPLSAVAVSCAGHGASFFILDHCQYFNRNEECRFCTLVPTQLRYNDTLKHKSVRNVDETMSKMLQAGDRLDFIQLSGGSLFDHDREVRDYIQYIEVVKRHLATDTRYNSTRIHLTSMPPQELKILEELRAAGLDSISFDLECTTKDFFVRYCPGKQRTFGYDAMRAALRAAISVFGRGNVFTIVIAGIEPSEIFLAGLEELALDGVMPTINIYHHDPLTTKMDVGEPNYHELIKLAAAMAPIFKEYDLRPGLLGCAHYDIGHDIRKGFFDNLSEDGPSEMQIC